MAIISTYIHSNYQFCALHALGTQLEEVLDYSEPVGCERAAQYVEGIKRLIPTSIDQLQNIIVQHYWSDFMPANSFVEIFLILFFKSTARAKLFKVCH